MGEYTWTSHVGLLKRSSADKGILGQPHAAFVCWLLAPATSQQLCDWKPPYIHQPDNAQPHKSLNSFVPNDSNER
jgi:hypothetical protein